MRTTQTPFPYNTFAREMLNVADALNRTAAARNVQRPYDYAHNGGSRVPQANGEVAVRLPVDAWATEEAYFLRAYLPGVNPESVEITFEQDELTIRGQFQPLEEGTEFLKRELYHGAFERRVSFVKPVNADAIEANFENGVLTLRAPKAESVKPKQIKVTTRSSAPAAETGEAA